MQKRISSQGRARAFSRAAVSLGVLLALASGCQLITGTYSTTSALSPCADLAVCCVTLGSAYQNSCTVGLTGSIESICTATRLELPLNCLPDAGISFKPDGGGISFPDSGGISFPDTGTTHHDTGTTSHDTGTTSHDTGTTTTPPNLDGTWNLTAVTCTDNGGAVSVSGVTISYTFSTGEAEEVLTVDDGCVITTDYQSETVTETTIDAESLTQTCGSGCMSADDCTSGSGGAVSDSFTLSGGTLGITLPVATTTCSSGLAVFSFQME